MKIESLLDIKKALNDVPDELLGNIFFGLGEGTEETISMVATEGSEKYDFPQVWDLVEKEYPQINEFNRLIQNIAKAQSNLGEEDSMDEMWDKYSEGISSEDKI